MPVTTTHALGTRVAEATGAFVKLKMEGTVVATVERREPDLEKIWIVFDCPPHHN